MKIVVFGAGATGTRVARQLLASAAVDEVEMRDNRDEVVQNSVAELGMGATVGRGRRFDSNVAGVVVATAVGSQEALARRSVQAGCHVVTTSDDINEVKRLLLIDDEARYRQSTVVVGAGFMPGFSCLLARVAARKLDEVLEVHVAKSGTGGPACARQHHRALSSTGLDWREGRWVRRAGGSGRELCWFPEPVEGQDCYRAALPDALLLVRAFPAADRITARVSATRRDRLTAPLPMLRRPHPEGLVGAIRVEVRGRRDGAYVTEVVGAVHPPAVAAGAVAATSILWAIEGRFEKGASGAAMVDDPMAMVRELRRRGLRASVFYGAEIG